MTLDIDGSVTGVAGGGWVVSNSSHALFPNCVARSNWNAYYYPPFGEGYTQLAVVNLVFSRKLVGDELLQSYTSDKSHQGFVRAGALKGIRVKQH